jgi:hypothetical protein
MTIFDALTMIGGTIGLVQLFILIWILFGV